jgi:histone H2A
MNKEHPLPGPLSANAASEPFQRSKNSPWVFVTDGGSSSSSGGSWKLFKDIPEIKDKRRATTTRITRSKRAGLQFPVGRVHRHLVHGKYASRIGAGAPVYLAAVMEYLAAEVLELAGNVTRDSKRSRIIPRHVQIAVHNDNEIHHLFSGVTISRGGVLQQIHSSLLHTTTKGKEKGKKGKTV